MAKRFTSSSVNWSLIMDTLSNNDKSVVMPFKLSYDKYLKEVTSKSADLPKIDWNFYKNKIMAPGMVDSFQKAYEGTKIPYPSDQGMFAKAEELNSLLIKNATEKTTEMNKKIVEFRKKLKELETVMKYSEMTIEEYYLARPDLRFDSNGPKFWPQNVKDDEASDEKDEKK